ncbi:MAG: PmoA family protein [Planctomycetaceae bacterium]|nr:PmoA family protein [Planctomycetaceae bacterium]
MKVIYLLIVTVVLCFASSVELQAEESSAFRFEHSTGQVVIFHENQPLMTYFYDDPLTTRPYFAHVKTLQGTQVTRNHPPQEGDLQDHASYHPGIFFAFGDISGNDYWRLKTKVKHAGFVKSSDDFQNSFTVENHYLNGNGNETVCVEQCRYTFLKESGGYVIQMTSHFFSPDHDFYFGDQEEMGLGIRLATSLREKGGNGRILNSEGLQSAAKTWGQTAKWVDYSGTINEQQVGVMLMTDPKNIRPSWWHNRDYGLFVANLFGQKAMHQGPTSQLVVKQGDRFRLGYGIYIHESDELSQSDLQKIYDYYSKQTKQVAAE